MTEEFQCEYCEKEFPEENAMLQHQRAVHPEEVSTGPDLGDYPKHWLILGGLAILLLGLVVYFWAPLSSWWGRRSLPSVYDHWHSTYQIKICGQTLPAFPRGEGDIHTHGKGRIHIHPHSERTDGKAANLGAFVRSLGGVLSDTRLGVPMRGTYENGDSCPEGGPGTVRVVVNGRTVDDPDGYVPRDGDNVIIMFGSD